MRELRSNERMLGDRRVCPRLDLGGDGMRSTCCLVPASCWVVSAHTTLPRCRNDVGPCLAIWNDVGEVSEQNGVGPTLLRLGDSQSEQSRKTKSATTSSKVSVIRLVSKIPQQQKEVRRLPARARQHVHPRSTRPVLRCLPPCVHPCLPHRPPHEPTTRTSQSSLHLPHPC